MVVRYHCRGGGRPPGRSIELAGPVGASLLCPVCGSMYDSLRVRAHLESGCLLGLLVGVLLDRNELRFSDRELCRLADSEAGIEWLWDGFGAPAADALEDVLVECGAEWRGEGT